jgi:3-isopropylmalate dehydratase small subunit
MFEINPFENIIIFRKTFGEHLKIIIKAKTQHKSVINVKGTEFTPKLHTDMVSSSRNTSLKLSLSDFSLKILRKGFNSLGAHQGREEGMRNERRGGLFIEKICHQLPDKAVDVQQP